MLDKIVDLRDAESHEVDSFRWIAPELHRSDEEGDSDSEAEATRMPSQAKVTSHTTQSDIFSLAMTIFEVPLE